MASIYVDGETGEVTLGPDPTPGDGTLSRAQAEALRAAAYTAEADPLFFKWQAGEGTQADWLAKRAEIRARYPYPE
jgi:hypothetical protein